MSDTPNSQLFDNQIILVDKAKNWTSFDVVKKLKNLLKVKKIGHAGTLDPLATGLLILCTGKKTKDIQGFQDMSKEYEVTFRLGATTKSYDAEFEPENVQDTSHLTREMVEKAMETFVGEIEQVPPVFSALRVGGKRAYQFAREGKEVELKPRNVSIYEFDMLDYTNPENILAKVKCSKGAYIRSLVHDLGQKLEVGGYVLELRRTKIGDFDVKEAKTIEEFN